MRVLGIDPGVSGAVAVLDDGIITDVFEIPSLKVQRAKRLRIIDIVELRRLLHQVIQDGKQVHAFVEDVHAMPGQGVTSMFRFGEAKGIIIGLLTGLECGFHLVTPQAWKRYFKLSTDKKEILLQAKQRFPDIAQKTKLSEHGAEAIFIGLFGYHYLIGELQKAAEKCK